MATKETTGTDIYSIRKSGVDVLSSPIPNCGYTPETLRSMAQAGYYLYKNGKKVK
jgi:hypothetical protein